MASPPFKVKAIYEYSSPHDDDLSFPTGQIISVTEEEDADWYVGEYTDSAGKKQEGLFPKNFVEKYEPEVPSRPVRAAKPKQQEPAPAPPPQARQEDGNTATGEPTPPVPASSKPAPPSTEPAATAASPVEEPKSPQAAAQPSPAPRLESGETAEPIKSEPAKKAPPPVAPKTSNLFKDRIAAFNQGGAAPIAPMQPGAKPGQPSNFIKKPFVAPPPSKNAYIPPTQKQEPFHKPYVREEDPEIRQRQEEDRQAAEAAGFGGNERQQREAGEDGEDVPQPTSLKERIALLQKQQAEQAQRRAEGSTHKEKRPKPPPKQPSVTSQTQEGEEEEELTRIPTTASTGRPSSDRQRSSMPPEPMSPRPSLPEHEILSDGHEADQSGAGETTDDAGTIGPEDSDEKPTPARAARAPAAPPREPDVGDEEDTTEGDGAEEEEEDSMDEETRRKEELRARMAKMSGGMGMGAMFNPFGAPPPAAPKKKKSTQDSARSKQAAAAEENEAEQPSSQRMAMPVPGMAMPGMAPPPRVQSPDSDITPRGGEDEPQLEHTVTKQRASTGFPDADDGRPEPLPRRSTSGAAPPVPKERPTPQSPTRDRGAPPPVPGGRPAPPPPAASVDSQPTPRPLPPAAPLSPGTGSESDDEMSAQQKRSSAEMSGMETNKALPSGAPPVPTSREAPPLPPSSHPQSRNSYFGADAESRAAEQRASRPPPPLPGQSQIASPRPPPPPPPTQSMPSRTSTGLQMQDDDATERGESDYEGDYDTDIPATEKHKDAVKATHAREPSLDDSPTAVERTPARTPLPRGVPPPPPSGSIRSPPPVPSAPRSAGPGDEDYDPYRYDSTRAVPPTPSAPPIPPPQESDMPKDESSADELYSGSPPRQSIDRAPPQPPPQAPPQTRAVPPPPPSNDRTAPPPPKQSLDVSRGPSTSRKSGDIGRTSMSNDHGQIARDVDLAMSTQWWTAPQPLPPSLQSRNGVDLLSESEESTTSKRGGKSSVSKDIYLLYMDYSQTIITARYDPKDPSDISLEQRHEPAPGRPRQDQLESYWQRYGAKIAEEVHAHGHKKDSKALGDGSPHGLVLSLLQPFRDVLQPVGTRAYGALIYTNLGASVQQFDEIRPGDIVTLRNAKFEGKHGLKQYKDDYGPQHVAIVDEWDGTKKKIRCWEQGRAKSKVREESFRLGDLRSGEVRVWRVVGREYVGWE